MDKQSFNRALKGLKNIHLPQKEKEAMLKRIFDLGDRVPMVDGYSFMDSIQSLFRVHVRFAAVTASLLIILLATGGTVFAAEGAVPGDALYGIKTLVNEPVIGAFALSQASEAAWQSKRAERRLEEMEVLLSEGRLDRETREKLESDFEDHVLGFNTALEWIENESENDDEEYEALETRIAFEARINAHARVIERVSKYTDNDDEETVNIAGRVRVSVSPPGTLMMAAIATDNAGDVGFLTAKKSDNGTRENTDKRLKDREDRLRKLVSDTEDRLSGESKKANKGQQAVLSDVKNSLEEAKGLLDLLAQGESSDDESLRFDSILNTVARTVEEANTFLRYGFRFARDEDEDDGDKMMIGSPDDNSRDTGEDGNKGDGGSDSINDDVFSEDNASRGVDNSDDDKKGDRKKEDDSDE